MRGRYENISEQTEMAEETCEMHSSWDFGRNISLPGENEILPTFIRDIGPVTHNPYYDMFYSSSIHYSNIKYEISSKPQGLKINVCLILAIYCIEYYMYSLARLSSCMIQKTCSPRVIRRLDCAILYGTCCGQS